MEEACSIYRQCLTNAQERALIKLIHRLTDQILPPTVSTVKNFAKEIRGSTIRKNWIANFVKRHEHELKSIYLKSMDLKCVQTEYPPAYKVDVRDRRHKLLENQELIYHGLQSQGTPPGRAAGSNFMASYMT